MRPSAFIRVHPRPFRRNLLSAGVAALAALVLCAAPAAAQSVRWQPPAALAKGERGALELVFEGAEPAGAIALPRIDGLTLLGSPSLQTTMTSINGKVSQSTTLSYPIRAEREGEIAIPPFGVETSAGTAIVAGVEIEIGRRAAAAAPGGDRMVSARLEAETRRPWAGEVFDVDLTIALAKGRRGEIVGKPTWQNEAIVAETWGDGVQVDAGGSPAVRMRTRALAPAPGESTLGPVTQEVRVDTGRRADPFARLGGDMLADMDRFFGDSLFDSVFARATLTDATVESNGAALDVRPLPQPAPAGFTGAVGQFTLESKLVPAQARTGEPVTWTLTLSGTGNWPAGVALPARAVPASLRTLQPKQQRHFEEGSLFSGAVSEDVVLIPTQPGALQLEPVRFTYFDPRTERYETTVVEPPLLNVSGSTIATSTGAGSAPGSSDTAGEDSQANGSPGSSSTSLARATSPDVPPHPAGARLPREPQAGVGVALPPLTAETFHRLLAAPFALLVLFWLALALRRAFRTDPRRRRREALRQLRAAVGQIDAASDAEARRRGLLAWQQAAAVILEIDYAAPTPAHVRERGASAFSDWAELWSESDAALYGREAALAEGWCDRARVLCRKVRPPRRNPLRALLPANLLPPLAAAALAIAIALPAASAVADDSTAAAPSGVRRSPPLSIAASEQVDSASPPLAVPSNPSTATAAGDTAAPADRHDDALALYAAGDFAAAREAWQAAIAADPRNWVARYNLGLAEAQLGQPGRALGQTAAAFLQQPANADVRWNLAAFAALVPGVDRALARFASDAEAPRPARLASPAAWQMLALAGACVLAVGLAMILWSLHSARDWRALAAGVALTGAVLGAVAWASLRQYGALADPGAALLATPAALRSVPTDAESAAPPRALPAGAVVVVDRHFLGWARVTLADGESGWLRSDALVPFWNA